MKVPLAFKKPEVRNWAPSQAERWLMFWGFGCHHQSCFFLVAVFGSILAEHGHMLHWMDSRNPVLHRELPFRVGMRHPALWDWGGKLTHPASLLSTAKRPHLRSCQGHTMVTLKCWRAFCTLTKHSLIASFSCYLDIFPSILEAGRISVTCKHSRQLCSHLSKSHRQSPASSFCFHSQ